MAGNQKGQLPIKAGSLSSLKLAYFNIWRGGPPGRRTNRPTWQMSSGPVRPWAHLRWAGEYKARACLDRDRVHLRLDLRLQRLSL